MHIVQSKPKQGRHRKKYRSLTPGAVDYNVIYDQCMKHIHSLIKHLRTIVQYSIQMI